MIPNAPACVAILAVTVVVGLAGLYGAPTLIQANLFQPYYLVRDKRFHTLLTSGFVHATGVHLLFNMLTLYFFGPALEQVIGTPRFALLYFLSLITSKARTYLQQRHNPQFSSLGASGAVSAVLFAAIVYFPNQSLYILPIPVPIPAPLFAVGYLVYSWYLAQRGTDGINHSAHIDGALTGLLFVAATDAGALGRLLLFLGSRLQT